jgi:hypothetical protein
MLPAAFVLLLRFAEINSLSKLLAVLLELDLSLNFLPVLASINGLAGRLVFEYYKSVLCHGF